MTSLPMCKPRPCPIREFNPVDGYFALIEDTDGTLLGKAYRLDKARLIAASRVLLAACQAAIRHLSECPGDGGTAEWDRLNVRIQLVAAIADATA